jgi:hypothetical protein
MIELRWREILSKVEYNKSRPVVKTVLQYRQTQAVVNASGAVCGHTDWSEWVDVPTIQEIPN